MHIANNKELLQAIDRLNAKKKDEEDKLLAHIGQIKQFVDPVYQVKRLLPRKVTIGEKLNNLLDETIAGSAELITGKFIPPPTASFAKIAGGHILKNAVHMAVHNNSLKIKAFGLSVLKNILN